MRTVFQPLRGWLISGGRSATQFSMAAVILFFGVGAAAETTNTLSDAGIQGRAFVEKILDQRPTENYTNSGVLQIRDANGKRTYIPIEFQIKLAAAGWVNIYRITKPTDLVTKVFHVETNDSVQIIHRNGPNLYWTSWNPDAGANYNSGRIPDAAESFAASDFWLCDLGLEFFHWPQQKVLKKEFHRQCACTVLESTNPNPTTNGYSRVVSWIDEESLGIVEAYAYDANGKKLKNFYPKNFEKGKNGQWQVQSLIMDNLQTGSRSTLEFDLKK